MPTTNCGADTPTKEISISAWSAARPRFSAAITPIVSPSASSQQIAPTISTKVAGNLDAMSEETSLRCR